MQLHTLKRNTANKKSRQVGRGGKRGKTSGRGTKGQKARSGHKIRPEIRDEIKRLPKLRGYRFASIQSTVVPINLDTIEKTFKDGDVVSPASLIEKGLIKSVESAIPRVKILGRGAISKKINIEKCAVSASAKLAIEKAGGSIK